MCPRFNRQVVHLRKYPISAHKIGINIIAVKDETLTCQLCSSGSIVEYYLEDRTCCMRAVWLGRDYRLALWLDIRRVQFDHLMQPYVLRRPCPWSLIHFRLHIIYAYKANLRCLEDIWHILCLIVASSAFCQRDPSRHRWPDEMRRCSEPYASYRWITLKTCINNGLEQTILLCYP